MLRFSNVYSRKTGTRIWLRSTNSPRNKVLTFLSGLTCLFSKPTSLAASPTAPATPYTKSYWAPVMKVFGAPKSWSLFLYCISLYCSLLRFSLIFIIYCFKRSYPTGSSISFWTWAWILFFLSYTLPVPKLKGWLNVWTSFSFSSPSAPGYAGGAVAAAAAAAPYAGFTVCWRGCLNLATILTLISTWERSVI